MMAVSIEYVISFLAVTVLFMAVSQSESSVIDFSDNDVKLPGLEWDHFVFSQQWPMSVCIDSNISHKHVCSIPTNVSTWTVHGIWPSLGRSGGPEFCNRSAKFDASKLQTILERLETFWPNLYTDSPLDEFWEHEWDKHGTCAMTLEDVGSELKYFTKGLILSRLFDLLGMFQKRNIVPTDSNTYQYNDIMAALNGALGQNPVINCIYDKETKTQYLVEIEFCMDKIFNVIACPDTRKTNKVNTFNQRDSVISMMQRPSFGQEEPCRDTEEIAYPTIKHN